MRHLLLIGISFALLLGSWGTALSALLCPHAASMTAAVAEGRAPQSHEEMPACCLQDKTQDQSAAHCPMSMDEPEPPPPPAAQAECAMQSGDQEPPAASAPAAPAFDHHAPNVLHPATSCAHCIRRSEQPPASFFTREPCREKRDGSEIAPAELKPLARPAFAFAPVVIPSQGAPPGQTRRHMLISVLLI